MSRFSKAEAEARGWIIVHQREQREVATAAGESRTIPASYRAEKYVNDVLINEEGETMGKLLERISLKEAQLDAANVDQRPVTIPSDVPLDEAGIEQRSVVILRDPEDPEAGIAKVSDAELTSRSRADAIVQLNQDEEPEMVHYRPTDDALAADESAALASQKAEEERTAGEDVDGEQVNFDNSGNLDSPGQSGPSALILLEDETVGEAAIRREEQSVEAENERVAADMDEVKGYVENVPDPVDLDELDAARARALAEEEEAKSLRDEEGEKAEHGKAVTAAGAEAEQKLADEQAEDDNPDQGTGVVPDDLEERALASAPNASANEPDHTVGQQKQPEVSSAEERQAAAGAAEQPSEEESVPAAPAQEQPQEGDIEATEAAEKLAAEKGVDLSKVKGSGAEGKVTKPDVESHLEGTDK